MVPRDIRSEETLLFLLLLHRYCFTFSLSSRPPPSPSSPLPAQSTQRIPNRIPCHQADGLCLWILFLLLRFGVFPPVREVFITSANDDMAKLDGIDNDVNDFFTNRGNLTNRENIILFMTIISFRV
mgnify:CR=1 FL=1